MLDATGGNEKPAHKASVGETITTPADTDTPNDIVALAPIPIERDGNSKLDGNGKLDGTSELDIGPKMDDGNKLDAEDELDGTNGSDSGGNVEGKPKLDNRDKLDGRPDDKAPLDVIRGMELD